MAAIKSWIGRLLVIGAFSMVCSSCGYQFSGLQMAPFGVNRFHVEVFENRTMEAGAEVLFANDLMNELTRDGRMILTNEREAQGLFSGELKLMDIETVARTHGYTATERRVKLTVDVALKDPQGRTLWVGKNMVASETYLVVPEKLTTEYNRKIAVSEVSKKIAQRVFQQLNWDF
jgi:hypothetical protein